MTTDEELRRKTTTYDASSCYIFGWFELQQRSAPAARRVSVARGGGGGASSAVQGKGARGWVRVFRAATGCGCACSLAGYRSGCSWPVGWKSAVLVCGKLAL
ncbi:Os09g0326301 [Oryza sativa Japonica Group]|uniref:Os09g0326301 protein n=1 Tax=Oryza sativa subsp. japonica TaxID=39947 RepID=A0A0P0XM90_ORYSJ|nr:Os09g0326301 [Oryza sativa Japonica Group]